MSPIQKKHESWRSALIRPVMASLCAIALCNCANDSKQDTAKSISGNSDEMSHVAFDIGFSETPLLDSLVLDCIGADTLHLVHSIDSKSFNLDLFPSDNWQFNAKLYANGTLMQQGEVTTALEAGSSVTLQIPMHALAGFVYIKIPLGFGNPAGAASGIMTLKSGNEKFTYPMEFDSDNAVFSSNDLPLDREYSVNISMQDAEGATIFSMDDTFYLDEETPIPNFQIESLRSKIALAIDVAKDVNLQVGLSLPAIKRSPVKNDLVISEFFVNPNTKDSTQFAFIEIYNGSTDSLSLEKCTIGKTSVASSSAEVAQQVLPPNATLVIGNGIEPEVPGTYSYVENFSIFGKSSGSIVLQCNGSVLDSLYYGKADTLHVAPLPIGSSSATVRKSTQLDLGLWKTRENSDSWCTGVPTPGIISACY